MHFPLLAKRTRWIEIALGVVAIFVAGVVWRELDLHERHQIQNMVRVAANSIRSDLVADMQSYARQQVYLAQHADFDGISKKNWTAHAQGYIDLNPWCTAVMWLEKNGQVGWVVPASANQERLLRAVTQQGAGLLDEMSASREPRMAHSFQLPTGETFALTIVPAFHAGERVGSIAIFTDVPKLLEAMLEDSSHLGYSMAVYDGDREIYHLGDVSPAEQRWSQSAETEFAGVQWRLRVWPSREILDPVESAVPELMAAVVSLLGLALIVATHFDFNAREKSLRLSKEIAERQHIEEALRASQERLAGVLDTSADAIISTDEALRITLFNQGAEKIFGYSTEEAIGKPLEVLLPPRFREAHRSHMLRFAAGPQTTMLMGERTGVMGLRKDGAEFPADAAISKLTVQGETVLTAILRDVSARVAAQEALGKAHHELEQRVAERTAELATANASLRQLSGHLLQSQEEERRRIARELHDNTAGNLVFIGMMLDKISGASPGDEIAKDVAECYRWVQHTMEDIRTLSYRMHPPMLEGLGLVAALRWYIAGFSKRSGIAILMRFDAGTPRLSEDVELALFRVVQESLTNIHRHSKSHKAEISLKCDEERVQLAIKDYGVGMQPELLKDGAKFGVGIAGMSERIRQLGGELAVVSGATGTTISATLPLEELRSGVAAGEPA